jgi:UDP-glucose 4-epimerase
MREIFKKEKIEAIIHFAGLKSVGESTQKPGLYIRNNIGSSIVLLNLMSEFNVKNLVFSSSATVYGVPDHVPLKESDSIGGCTNPYGQTKLEIEYMLNDYAANHKDANIAILRYFNPIGAHESGLIGEDPQGIPNNLMPYITQVAVGKRPFLNVFGNDYKTHDGTGVRDYIHVVDLALGHVKALKKLSKGSGLSVYNLGTGQGYSVLDIVKNFEEATGVKIPYVIKPRRAGDIDICYADSSKAERELGWKAQRGIKEMCADSWRWQKNNPNGYDD